MDAGQIAELLVNNVLRNRWIPHDPYPKQAVFLALPDREALYGGAAGGGKSDAILMAALMYVDVPGYNAIIFRKTYSDLALPEAIMARSHEWLGETEAKWDGSNYRWTFPSGATLSFGYLNHDKDKYRYQSAAFQFIAFDELTQFPFEHYSYLFSRLRKLLGLDVPVRMRGGTNPGGLGNDWVYERFIVNDEKPFVPALLSDNPFIDQDEYRKALGELDETTRRQLEEGLWVTDPAGKPFTPEYWEGQNRFLVGSLSERPAGRYISWDTALEDKDKSAYSVGVVGELQRDYRLRIIDVWRGKPLFPELPDVMAELAYKHNRDNELRANVIEGAASGKPAIQTLRASSDDWLAKSVVEMAPKGSKEERANRAAVWCKRGLVLLPHPDERVQWLLDFEREIYNFPETRFMDQVDAFAQLVIYLENFLTLAWHGLEAKKRAVKQNNRVTKALREEGVLV